MIIFVDMKEYLALLLGMFLFFPASAAGKDFFGIARVDKTVHDFGTFTEKDGAQSCKFMLTNIGTQPLLIEAVVSSCGCTSVKWTRAAIAPGTQGTVEATYSNEDGPYPFDKTLTVYLGGAPKPVILHLRGEVVKKRK